MELDSFHTHPAGHTDSVGMCDCGREQGLERRGEERERQGPDDRVPPRWVTEVEFVFLK